jgi:hypothetical protein
MRAGHRPLRRMARAGRRLLRRMLARASRRRACPQRTGTPHSREWGARAVVARAVAAMYQPLTPITGQSYLRKLSQLCTFLFRALCLPSPPSPPLVRPPGSERASSPREMREHALSAPPSLPPLSPSSSLVRARAQFRLPAFFPDFFPYHFPQGDGDEGDAQAGAGGAGRAGGAGPGRVARQLLYSELLSRPGGPWAWMEVSGARGP